jgi:hypothetical protein
MNDKNKQTNSVALSPRANYTDWMAPYTILYSAKIKENFVGVVLSYCKTFWITDVRKLTLFKSSQVRFKEVFIVKYISSGFS